MPKLPDYISHETPNVQVGDTSGSAGGAAVLEGAATGMKSAGEVIQRYAEQNEASQYAVAHSALTAEATTVWEDVKKNKDASDPEVRQTFLDQYNEKVDRLSDNITSPSVRNHAAEVSAQTKAHFAEVTLADQATLAGKKAIERVTDVKNNAASSAYNDPTFFDSKGNVTDMYVAASGLPQSEVPKVTVAINKEIAKSTIDGMLDRGDVANARKDIESGRFDKVLDGSEKATLLGHVATVEKQIEATNKADQTARLEAKRELSQTLVDKYSTFLADPTVDVKALGQQVTADNDVSVAGKNSFFELAGRIAAQGRAVLNEDQPGVLASVMSRIDKGQMTEEQLTGLLGNGLSTENYKYARTRLLAKQPADRFETRVLSQLMTDVKAHIGADSPVNALFGNHILTPDQERQLSTATSWIMRQLQAEKDPAKRMEMMTPGSKTYLLNGFKVPTSGKADTVIQGLIEKDQRATTAPAAKPSLDTIFGGQ